MRGVRVSSSAENGDVNISAFLLHAPAAAAPAATAIRTMKSNSCSEAAACGW